jgi:hypothetical protein
MKKTISKLSLQRQDIRRLTDTPLATVGGGTSYVTISLCNEFSQCGCRVPPPKLE